MLRKERRKRSKGGGVRRPSDSAGSGDWAFWVTQRMGGEMKTGRNEGRNGKKTDEDRKVGEGHAGGHLG